jgi:hypothetical protein
MFAHKLEICSQRRISADANGQKVYLKKKWKRRWGGTVKDKERKVKVTEEDICVFGEKD